MSSNDPTQQTPAPPVVPRPQPTPPAGPPPETPPPTPPAVAPPSLPPSASDLATAPVKPHSSVDPIEGYEAFFCLDQGSRSGHQGSGTDIFDMTRVFYVEPDFAGAPTCPRCRRQTSAVPLADASALPPHLQAIKERLEKAERGSV